MPPATSYVLNKLSLLLPVFLLPALIACSTSPRGEFRPLPVESGKASVYVYRPKHFSNALYAPELFINDAFRLQIKNGRMLHFSLPAGETRFELKSDYSTAGNSRLGLDLQPAKTYFIRIDTSLALDDGAGYKPYRRGFILLEVPAQKAYGEIAECCQPSGSAGDKALAGPENGEATQKPAGSRFSTEKTSNLFTH